MNKRAAGVQAALASALFLGLAPIFGKQAILFGLSPLAVVAYRTALAAGLLSLVILAFKRQYFYIYPAGLLGCLLAGGINGLGSLLYYSALGRIDASVGQLLYALYPLFVALWLRLDHQPLSRLTWFRLILALPALYLLTQGEHQPIDLLGMGMMLAASALYALHLPINQRVLYDMPAPTVTLYTLIAMSLVVVPAYILSGLVPGQTTYQTSEVFHQTSEVFSGLVQDQTTDQTSEVFSGVPLQAWLALLALTLVTFLSRLTLFLGVKHLGGMQTALLGLGELLVTVVLAHLWLGDHFSPEQWIGMVLLVTGLGLVGLEKVPARKRSPGGWLSWLRPPGLPADFPWQPRD